MEGPECNVRRRARERTLVTFWDTEYRIGRKLELRSTYARSERGGTVFEPAFYGTPLLATFVLTVRLLNSLIRWHAKKNPTSCTARRLSFIPGRD